MRGMMRWTAATFAALALFAGAGGGQALRAPPHERRAPSAPHVQALLDGYVSGGLIPGITIAFAKGDAPPVFLSSGTIAADPGAPAAGPDSLWRVYSMTKPVTAMAAMILIERGKIGLDQPISDFIPAFGEMRVLVDPAKGLESRPAARPITVRNLLTHTAGLGYTIVTTGPLLGEYHRLGINPATLNVSIEARMRAIRPSSLEAFANRVATLPLIADPGTRWSYSIGLDVLGRVIEVASGMPFDRFVQTELLDPLGMTSSYWTVPASQAERLSTNYLITGEKRVLIDRGAASVWLSPPSFPYGGAGLVSSARDYDRFLHMLLDGGMLDGVRVMKPETVRLAMSNLLPPGVEFAGIGGGTGGTAAPVRMGFGAGGSVYLEDLPGGGGKGTYGWGGAAGTVAWVDPEHGVRGVIMANYMPSDRLPLRAQLIPAVYGDLMP